MMTSFEMYMNRNVSWSKKLRLPSNAWMQMKSLVFMLPKGPHVKLCAFLVKECFTSSLSKFCSPEIEETAFNYVSPGHVVQVEGGETKYGGREWVQI